MKFFGGGSPPMSPRSGRETRHLWRQLPRFGRASDKGVSQRMGGGSTDCHVAGQLATGGGRLPTGSPSGPSLPSEKHSPTHRLPLVSGEPRDLLPIPTALVQAHLPTRIPAWLRGSRSLSSVQHYSFSGVARLIGQSACIDKASLPKPKHGPLTRFHRAVCTWWNR